MNSAPVATTGLLILLLGGCQQPNNPAIPLSPINPMGTNTRVPPPQTGSYGTPNGYYQGQASAAPLGGNQYASVPAASDDGTPTPAPVLNGWSDGGAAGAAVMAGVMAQPDASGVQPAAYQSDSGVASAGGPQPVIAGGRPAPRIPAAALQPSGYAETPLQPNLRGMEVVDMTPSSPLMPSDPPSLQVVDQAQMRTANALGGPAAAPSFRSLSPAADEALAASATTGEQPDAPSTSKSRPSTDASGSANLPWRKPLQ